MRARILYLHEPDGPRELLEVEALGDYIPERIDLDKLRVGVIEHVELPASLVTDYGEWQEFPDGVHNRSHLRAQLARVFHYRRELARVESFTAEILQEVVKEMKPSTLDFSEQSGIVKNRLQDINVFDSERALKHKRVRISRLSAEESVQKALGVRKRFREFLRRNNFPWISRSRR